jgi:hypothetical protein
MYPMVRDCRICRGCSQVVLRRGTRECPECGGDAFWELENIMKVFHKVREIAGRSREENGKG